jgi:hypothetical protein
MALWGRFVTGRPSYDLKLDRAEEHLLDLECAIDAWCSTHPYEVRVDDGKRDVHRFHWKSEPPDRVAILAADFLYNIHSALSHLAAALVTSSRRRSTMFPILWQGVWDDPVEGESQQRVKDREKWNSFTKTMDDRAVAIIKTNQPPDLGADNDKSTSGLAVINRLRNADAHTKLPVVASRLVSPHGTLREPDGTLRQWIARDMRDTHGLDDGAQLHDVPDGAMDVQIAGIPVLVIDIGLGTDKVVIPDSFRDIAYNGTRGIIDGLRPYVRPT